ncbi:MAG: inlJ [Bacteroidetes bacterium]|nr:inlJ [Bacteroidota bacterium]
MKNKIIKFQILLLLLCVASINSYSQVNMERFIEFKCNVGANFSVNLAADSSNTKAIIKNGMYEKIVNIQIGLFSSPSYNLNTRDTIIRIYGNVTKIDFRCSDGIIRGFNIDSNSYLTQIWAYNLVYKNVSFNNSNNLEVLYLQYSSIESIDVRNLENLIYLGVPGNEELTKLDLRELTRLKILMFQNTGVSDININGLNELRDIDCYNTNLSTMGYDSLFCALPECSDSLSGMIVVIYDSTYSDFPTYMSSNSQNLISKNWFPTDRNYQLMPPSYGTFDCSSIGMDDIELDFVEAKVYPNPAIDYLSIETKEVVQMLEVYDALGRRAISKTPNQNNFSLDISNLEKGIYILKLQTNEGIGSYKIVKN